jgi:hypothetical protein
LGFLPFACLPTALHSRLDMGRRLTGISGTELPVTGSLSLLLTVGNIRTWVNFIVMKENFVMSHPILGYTLLQDLHISVKFATRTVLANNIVVMSQFIDQDSVQTKHVSSLIESINSVLDTPQCHSMLHFIASKFSHVHSWPAHSAQFASSSGFS